MNTDKADKSYKKNMKTYLQHLQSSNSGKENLVNTVRNPQDNMAIDDSYVKSRINETAVQIKEKKQNLSLAEVNPSLYKKLILEDLSSSAGPSEKYWEVIAERRRKALAELIEENQRLYTVFVALEEENMCCKTLLENTTDLVNTLTGMINETNYQSDDNQSSDIEDNLNTPDSFNGKHIHKKMKLSNSANECSDST